MMINEYHAAIQKHLDVLKRRKALHLLHLHCVGEDEIYDPTLVSNRVYGTRNYSHVVLIATEVNHTHEPLPLGNVYLPTLVQIQYYRKKFGVE